jgi:hypothetical protein
MTRERAEGKLVVEGGRPAAGRPHRFG